MPASNFVVTSPSPGCASLVGSTPALMPDPYTEAPSSSSHGKRGITGCSYTPRSTTAPRLVTDADTTPRYWSHRRRTARSYPQAVYLCHRRLLQEPLLSRRSREGRLLGVSTDGTGRRHAGAADRLSRVVPVGIVHVLAGQGPRFSST